MVDRPRFRTRPSEPENPGRRRAAGRQGEKRRRGLNTPSANPSVRRCWAEIDLEALLHNAGVVRAQIGAQPGIMAIVKANAYGHGVAPVVRALADLARMFGVANVREAAAVREVLPEARVFILGPAL